MGYAIAFFILWLVFAVPAVFMLAAVPSSTRASNGDVLALIGICGAIAAVIILVASGLINLFT